MQQGHDEEATVSELLVPLILSGCRIAAAASPKGSRLQQYRPVAEIIEPYLVAKLVEQEEVSGHITNVFACRHDAVCTGSLRPSPDVAIGVCIRVRIGIRVGV